MFRWSFYLWSQPHQFCASGPQSHLCVWGEGCGALGPSSTLEVLWGKSWNRVDFNPLIKAVSGGEPGNALPKDICTQDVQPVSQFS